MKSYIVEKIAIAAIAAALTGCSGSAATPGAGLVPAAPQQAAPLAQKAAIPPPCTLTPKVWASSLGSNQVYGFAPGNTVCKTLSGPYNGLNINAPIALAVSKFPQRLYVADLNNDRILVFTYNGVFIKWFNTNMGTTLYQPWGVCVAPNGTVGVANRQYNNYGTYGNVEFFPPNAASGSGPTGDASGFLQSDQFCAFDRKGNFFVDGTATSGNGGGQQIAYVPRAKVNLPGQSLVNSGLGNSNFWVGMFSRRNGIPDDTLSVGTSVGSSSTQTVMNWKVAGPPNGPLAFASTAPYTLSSYPVTIDAVYQLAPSQYGAKGTLYIADYGDNEVLNTQANGGPVAGFAAVGGTVGVATVPTGQW